MLTRIKLQNYRKFSAFSISLNDGNILVGPNNAGKSAIIDCLRILHACLAFSARRRPIPIANAEGGVFDGHNIPDNLIPLDIHYCVHNYGADDAKLEFRHENGNVAVVLIHPDRPVRFYIETRGERLLTIKKFSAAFELELLLVPTLGPLEFEERWVEDGTINRGQLTRTSSRHLRNVWYRASDEEFGQFAEDVEDAWPNVRIEKPKRNAHDRTIIDFMYEEQRVPREVRWAGFGFQIWLQLLTHLSRASDKAIIVIDEPDIYLHPELQKKLVAHLRGRFAQYVVATHAIEIINDAEPLEIASINPQYRSAKRIVSEDEYSSVYQYVGSTQNFEFARVAKIKKVVFIEGQDKKIIDHFAKKGGHHNIVENVVPFIQLGGFENWRRAKDAVWAFSKILELEIDFFCIFDRDYKSADEVSAFEAKLDDKNILCSVLRRKEIENLLLNSEALQRLAIKRLNADATNPFDEAAVMTWIEKITEAMRVDVYSQITAKGLQYARQSGTSDDDATIMKQIGTELDERWSNIEERLMMVPGKKFLSAFNEKLQSNEAKAITHKMLVDELQPDEIDPHFSDLLARLDLFCKV